MYQDDSQADLYTTHMLTGTHKDPHTQTHTPPSGEVIHKVTASPCGNAWEV